MKELLKKHRKKLIAAGIVIILIITIVVIRNNMAQKQREMMQTMNQTETAAIEKRTLMSSISATGSIISSESKEISVSLSNVEVESVNFKVGDMVSEGDILCTFNSEDIEESLAQAKASLNVTTTKTQMDITSSERSLAEAVESSEIEQSRIDADVAEALNDYESAVDDMEDAKTAYDNAESTTNAYKSKINSLNTQKNNLEAEKKSYITSFENARDEIVRIIKDGNGTITFSGFDSLTITDTLPENAGDIYEVTAVTSSDTVSIDNTSELSNTENIDNTSELSNTENEDGNTESEETVNENIDTLNNSNDINTADTTVDTSAIDTQLANMKTAQESFKAKDWDSLSADISAQITSVQKQYETAAQNESTLEKAYDQAVSSADSQYDAYEQKVRNQEDTARNNESTIANKTDSVTTSKLNATTSGTSDKNQIEQYEEQLEDCTVVSPIAGVITALNIEEGDTYSGSAIATIEDISSYKITTEIDEYDIVDVKAGQKVVIKTNGTGDLELDGTVETVAPRATTSSGGNSDVTYTVTITVDTPCEDLRLDMTAKLSIILESKENVLTVPYNAVQEDETGNFYIEVLEDEVTADTENQMENSNESDAPSMSEGVMPQMPEGEFPSANGEMPQMPDNSNMPQRQGKNGTAETGSSNTKRIFITKGIESDYYIEVISDEIEEGMQVVVPKTEDTQSIQNMMMRQGPMGGF